MSGRPRPVGVGVVPEVVRRTHPGLCWLWVPVCACVCVGGGMLSGSGAVRPGCGLRGLCLSGVWRGVGCGGWVGCDLYSGREHHCLCSCAACLVIVNLVVGCVVCGVM